MQGEGAGRQSLNDLATGHPTGSARRQPFGNPKPPKTVFGDINSDRMGAITLSHVILIRVIIDRM